MALAKFVERLRAEHPDRVAGFDPANGNDQAKYLLVMEAPDAGALLSGFVSLNNDDPTSRNLTAQLNAAGVDRADIAVWNIVPWYLGTPGFIRGPATRELSAGIQHLLELVAMLPKLRCVALIGGHARKALIPLSMTTQARILGCHHPSQRVPTVNQAAALENIGVFRNMLEH